VPSVMASFLNMICVMFKTLPSPYMRVSVNLACWTVSAVIVVRAVMLESRKTTRTVAM
jgi:hypothetical protein